MTTRDALRRYLLRIAYAHAPFERIAEELLLWAAGLPADATPASALDACRDGEHLLWLARHLGHERDVLISAVRPSALRALRVYAPVALERAGLTQHAAALREAADHHEPGPALREAADTAQSALWQMPPSPEVNAAIDAMTGACGCARDAWPQAGDVRWTRAAESTADSARGAGMVVEGDDGATAEARLCAAEVRVALPGLAQRLDAALREAASEPPGFEYQPTAGPIVDESGALMLDADEVDASVASAMRLLLGIERRGAELSAELLRTFRAIPGAKSWPPERLVALSRVNQLVSHAVDARETLIACGVAQVPPALAGLRYGPKGEG